MTRLHPFDYAFADLAADRFSEIRAEADRDHRDAHDRMQFPSFQSVQHILHDIEVPEFVEANAHVAAEYVTALYMAYRYWDAGCQTWTVSRDDFDAALWEQKERAPSVDDVAAYIQFPERWFWAQIESNQPHEPLDGLFVAGNARARELTTLAALGLRPERGGFSQLAITASVDELAAAPKTARQPPFAPRLEGGDSAGMKSLATAGELLHLTTLAIQIAHRG